MSSESFLQHWAKTVIKGPGQTTVDPRPVCDSLPRRNTLLQPGLLRISDLEALLSLQSSCLQNPWLQPTAQSSVSEWNSHLIVISSGCCSMEIWCSDITKHAVTRPVDCSTAACLPMSVRIVMTLGQCLSLAPSGGRLCLARITSC